MLPNNDKTKVAWRQSTIEIPAKSTEEVHFRDTKPNHVYLNNLSANPLYLGVNTIPSESIYEMDVDGFGSDVHAQQTGFTRCMIYNAGATPARVTVTSFEAEFNPAVLQRKSKSSSGGGGGGGTGDGIIRGFQVALPAGSNNIGKVEVTKIPDQKITFDTLPAGVNKIGKVDVEKLPPLPAGNSYLGKVGVEGGLTIVSMPPVSLNGNVTLSDTSFSIKGASTHYHYMENVGTTEIIISLPFEITSFKYISNDDPDNDLYVSFNTAATTDPFTGQNATIVLKPGDSISDLNIKAYAVKLRRPTGAGFVRFMGV